MLFPKYILEDLSVGSGSIIGKSKIALRGNISLGHVTNCKTIIFGTVMDDVILLSTWICGFTTH
jgi:hypothetical protein